MRGSEARRPSQGQGVKESVEPSSRGANRGRGVIFFICTLSHVNERRSHPSRPRDGIGVRSFSPPPPDSPPRAREITAQSAERGEKVRGGGTADALAASRATRILPRSRRVARTRWEEMRRTAGKTARPRPVGPEAEGRAGEAAATRRCDAPSTRSLQLFPRLRGAPVRRRAGDARAPRTTRRRARLIRTCPPFPCRPPAEAVQTVIRVRSATTPRLASAGASATTSTTP